MIDRTRRLLDGAALLAVLLLPTTVLAQDAGRGAAPAGTAAPQRSAPDRAPESAAEAPGSAERAAVAEERPARRDTLTKMRAAEISHRERLAVINRLRELATAQGNAERLALLDKLEVKENSRYASVAENAANRLGDTVAYRQSLIKLAAGRARRTVEADKPERAQPAPTPESRKARDDNAETTPAAKRAGAAQADDSSGDKPKRKDKTGKKLKRANGANADAPRDPKPERAPPAEGSTPAPAPSTPRSGS